MEIDRNDIGDPGGLDPGQSVRSLQQALLKLAALSAVVALQPQIERNFDGALRIVAEIDLLRLPQCAQHQAAADEQRQRERDLQYDQAALQPRAMGAAE